MNLRHDHGTAALPPLVTSEPAEIPHVERPTVSLNSRYLIAAGVSLGVWLVLLGAWLAT